MEEVTPGIYWMKMPIDMEDVTLSHINTYLIRGDDGYLLVDSGWNTDGSFATLETTLNELGAGIGDITRIVVTHVHPDHFGMAGRIKKLSGASMAMHEIEKNLINSRYVTMDELLGQTEQWSIANGAPAGEAAVMRDATLGLEQYIVPAYPDIVLHGGETITTGPFTFRVLWTPGHSCGHVCLYEPDKKLLISGDHILPTITPNVSVHPQSIENPLGRYLESLKEIRKLDVELVLPGHDVPFTQLVRRIDEIIEHHRYRNGEILASLDAGPKTAYLVAADVTWGVNSRWQDLPDFHKRMAIFETLSHLEMMTAEGRLQKQSVDDVIYYRQT